MLEISIKHLPLKARGGYGGKRPRQKLELLYYPTCLPGGVKMLLDSLTNRAQYRGTSHTTLLYAHTTAVLCLTMSSDRCVYRNKTHLLILVRTPAVHAGVVEGPFSANCRVGGSRTDPSAYRGPRTHGGRERGPDDGLRSCHDPADGRGESGEPGEAGQGLYGAGRSPHGQQRGELGSLSVCASLCRFSVSLLHGRAVYYFTRQHFSRAAIHATSISRPRSRGGEAHCLPSAERARTRSTRRIARPHISAIRFSDRN